MLIRILIVIVRFFVRILFRVEITGLENYHAAGDRVLIIANHTSLLDGMFFYLFLPEPPTFAINTEIASRWYFKPFLMFSNIIEMDPTNPVSTKTFIRHLESDCKALIFPEGRITVTSGLMKIYEGPGMIVTHSQAVVLPIGIEGAQYSTLSYLKNVVKRRWFPKVRLTIHPPELIAIPQKLKGRQRHKAATAAITRIMRKIALDNCNYQQTLFEEVIDASKRHGNDYPILEDINREPINFKQLLLKSFVLGGLMARKTEPGERIGLLLPNTIANVVCVLALHSRRRIPAMLNFTSGKQGLLSACDSAQIKRVYTSHKFVEGAGLEDCISALKEKVDVIFLEDLRDQISLWNKLSGLIQNLNPKRSFKKLTDRQDPDDTALVLFTSGSEGVPKGVALSHKNILANRAQIHVCVDLTPQDVVFNALPMFHSFGMTAGTITPLLDGAKIFLYPTPLHYRLIPELCYELKASLIFGTNTFLAGYARHAHPYDFYNIRYVVAGGEKLQKETNKLWMERFGIRIFEGYGATEASPVIAVNTPQDYKPGTVGCFVAGLDHYLEPVEGIDEGGRLYVSGPNIMNGYLLPGNDGEVIPPQTERGKGWYDTGDIVTIDDEGFITIRDRAKRFAKLGGEMVSLTTVEELAMSTWPEYQHAAISIADKKKGEQIILITTYQDAERQSIVETCRGLGMSEMNVPRKIETTGELPVTGTGKIDYRGITATYLKSLT